MQSQIKRECEIKISDPNAYSENKLKLQSRHRQEINELENEIDEEQAEKLKDLNENLLENMKDQLARGEMDLANRMQTQCKG